MDTEDKTEPSAYTLYRELKAAGYVSSVETSGKVMVSATQEVPDAHSPQIMREGSEGLLNLPNSVGFEGDRVDSA